MKKEFLYIIAFIIVITLAIGGTMIGKKIQSDNVAKDDVSVDSGVVVLPQLSSDAREQSETMVLLGAPPSQPVDHIDRWNPDFRHESCLLCHATPETTGARALPANHYYDDNINNPIFRDNCIQCHGEQKDSKSAFNE